MHRRRVSFIPGGGGGRARAPEPPVLYAYALLHLLHLLNSANLSAARKSLKSGRFASFDKLIMRPTVYRVEYRMRKRSVQLVNKLMIQVSRGGGGGGGPGPLSPPRTLRLCIYGRLFGGSSIVYLFLIRCRNAILLPTVSD